MFTGWKAFLGKPFPVQRPLENDEIRNKLDRSLEERVPPYEWGSVLQLNSTYAEVVDRRYRLRGMFYTLATFLCTLLLAAIAAFLVWDTLSGFIAGSLQIGSVLFRLVFGVIPFAVMAAFLWHISYRYDLFQFTHYPIRFNRKERMIYVFRGPDEGGILEVPWEDAYFHIGTGANHSFIRDLRCHVMAERIVVDTFTVGHYFDDTQIDRVRSLWEFIRRYMEAGPEAVGPDPLDRYLTTSTDQTLRNCYVHVAASLGAFAYRIRYALFPVYVLLTMSRWAVLKTCRKPAWPATIEEKCRIDPSDPHQWKEPSFTGEFSNDAAINAHELKRMEPFLR